MVEAIAVVTTTDQRGLAQRIADVLVERRLAGCVQILGPIESVYRWEGKVETVVEWQCSIKTTRERYAAVEQAICELHTYTTPEIIALPIEAGSEAYLKWLAAETGE